MVRGDEIDPVDLTNRVGGFVDVLCCSLSSGDDFDLPLFLVLELKMLKQFIVVKKTLIGEKLGVNSGWVLKMVDVCWCLMFMMGT